MTSENQEMASGDLDALLNEHFAGKIVRKDLTKPGRSTRSKLAAARAAAVMTKGMVMMVKAVAANRSSSRSAT